MNSTAAPWSRSVAVTANSRSTSAADSAAVGSSITMTRASRDRALPISTTCWSAIDRPRAGRAGSSGTPSLAKTAAASASIARRSIRRPPGPRRAPPGPAAGAAHWLAADEHVLRHRQVGEQRRLLVDHRDAGRPGGRGPGQGDLASAHRQRAAVRLVHPGQDLDQGGLARAVLAKQRVHRAGPQLHRPVGQGPNRAERLGRVPQFEDRSLGKGGLRDRVLRDGRLGNRRLGVRRLAGAVPPRTAPGLPARFPPRPPGAPPRASGSTAKSGTFQGCL